MTSLSSLGKGLLFSLFVQHDRDYVFKLTSAGYYSMDIVI